MGFFFLENGGTQESCIRLLVARAMPGFRGAGVWKAAGLSAITLRIQGDGRLLGSMLAHSTCLQSRSAPAESLPDLGSLTTAGGRQLLLFSLL